MPIPESEKGFPAFSQPLAALALAVFCASAQAGPTEDYDTGLAAYRRGDVASAMVPLKRAADDGHAAAQALYGLLLDQSDFNEQAVVYLRKAADQADPDGQYGLAVMYLGGEGVERSPADAGRLLRAAAAQGHVHAITSLAQAYLTANADLGATDRNSTEARELIEKAADVGYLPAIDALALAYANGESGLAQDAALAEKWRARGAEVRARKDGAKGAGK